MTEQKLKASLLRTLAVCWAMGSVWSGLAVGADGAGAERAGIFDDHAEAQATTDGQEIKVGSFGQVDLHVKDLEVSQVLQLLSLQSQRNIIASRNVAGSISADLYGVDFYEALDAILHTNGFGYQEKGNLIFVYTTAELDAIKEAERQVIHRIVRLNYITAADASAFVTPLLSQAGSLSVSSDVGAGFQPSIGDGGANSFAHSDTLIIHDYAENVDEIVAVLHELDKRPKQVLVEATILQAGLIEQNAFGVDLSVLADFAVNKFLDPIGVIDEVISGVTPFEPPGRAGVSTTVGNTQSGLSGVKIGIVTHSVAAFIRALDDVTDTTVIANPKVLVLNRQKSDLLVGRKLGYLSSTATDTSTTQTVEFLEIGTQLTLRPFVSDDGFVRMELRPSVSDGNTNRTVGTFVIPETRNQEMTTNVVVRNGQTIVMGGLFKEDTTVTRKQVPGLGDIPILGALFKGHDDEVTRDEVIFLITPTIVKDEALYQMSDRVSENIEIAKLGAREGLLPWSHSKMIAAHLRDAQQFFEQGDSQKALWSADMALAADPQSVEAARLKERVTGQSVYSPVNFSILQEAVDKMIHSRIDSRHGPSEDLPTDGDVLEQPRGSVPVEVDPHATTTQPADGVAQQAQGQLGGDPEPTDELHLDQAEGLQEDGVLDAPEAASNGDADTEGDVWTWAKNILEPEKVEGDEPQIPQASSDSGEDQGLTTVKTAVEQVRSQSEDQEAQPEQPAFADEGEFTDWVDSDPDADEMWREMIETNSVQDTQATAVTQEGVSPQASDAADTPIDDEATFTTIRDEQAPAGGDTFGRVDAMDNPAALLPAIDQPAQYADDVDMDMAGFEWDSDAAVTPVTDEAVDADSLIEQAQDIIDLQGGYIGEPDRLRFTDDQVGSTDPFDAVVEWLLTSEREQDSE